MLGFFILPKETFSSETTFTVINKYCKGAVVQIGTVFRPIWHVLPQMSKVPIRQGVVIRSFLEFYLF